MSEYTVGVEPLQQYLVELDHGRLQVLDVAWDTKAGHWFHLHPSMTLKPDDGLHWTGPYKNWQARCATCHQAVASVQELVERFSRYRRPPELNRFLRVPK